MALASWCRGARLQECRGAARNQAHGSQRCRPRIKGGPASGNRPTASIPGACSRALSAERIWGLQAQRALCVWTGSVHDIQSAGLR